MSLDQIKRWQDGSVEKLFRVRKWFVFLDGFWI